MRDIKVYQVFIYDTYTRAVAQINTFSSDYVKCKYYDTMWQLQINRGCASSRHCPVVKGPENRSKGARTTVTAIAHSRRCYVATYKHTYKSTISQNQWRHVYNSTTFEISRGHLPGVGLKISGERLCGFYGYLWIW